MAILRTAFVYFLAIFAFAFLLGVMRVMVLAPAIGETAAVLLEIPLVLAASWLVIRRLLRGLRLMTWQLGAMGALALTLLLTSEIVLARVLEGRSAAAWLAEMATPLGLVGLVAQLGFSAMPLVAGRKGPPDLS